MRERGWQDGRNVVIKVRAGDGGGARALASELVVAGVDIIVAQGPMVFGARASAGTIPIVFNINGDPVEAKLVTSLAHPGGTVTGLTALSMELTGKRLELLKQAVPRIVRVAAIANQAHPGVQTEYQATRAAARKLSLALQWFPVYSAADFNAAFDAIERDAADAVVAIPDNLINEHAKPIARFAARRRLPTISGWAEFAEAGNLMSYGPNLRGYYRHVAAYVDKLLKGAQPADLPVEQPTEFELVVNLRTAKMLEVTVPTSVLLRADRTIT
jgi:putative tryptophan/tyrosine transport system substrate-binding protein